MTKTYSHAEHHERMVKLAHPDAKQDRAMVKKMVKKEALTGRAMGGPAPRAKGGKPKSQVNVVIAPRGGGDKPGMPMPPVGGAPGPMPIAARPAAPIVPPMRGPVPVVPGGPSAPMPAKKGGKVAAKKRANGGPLGASPDIARKFATGGAAYNHGAKETKSAGSYNHGADEVRKPAPRQSRELANVDRPKMMKGYDAGAGSAEGRLEKEKRYGVKAKTRDRY